MLRSFRYILERNLGTCVGIPQEIVATRGCWHTTTVIFITHPGS